MAYWLHRVISFTVPYYNTINFNIGERRVTSERIKCDPTVFASKLDKVIVRGSRGKWGSKGSLLGGGGFKAYFRLYYVKLISLNFPKGSWHPPFPFDPRMEIMAGTWRDKLMDRAISNISFKHFKTNISNECKTI